MKNVTVTLDEDVLRWARIRAAKSETSVSRLLGDLLKQEMRREADYQIAMNDFLSRRPGPLKSEADVYPRREELYDR